MGGPWGPAGAVEFIFAVALLIYSRDLGAAAKTVVEAGIDSLLLEAVFVAILPEQELGIALKVADGTTRGAECAIATLLIRAGVLEAGHPAVKRFWNVPVVNCRGRTTGWIRPGTALS